MCVYQVGLVNFHCNPVGSQTIVLGNGSEEDVLGVRTYKLRLHGGHTLLLHDALYTHGMRVCLLSLVSLMKLGFFFNSRTDSLDLLHDDNVFGHATLKNDFLVLDLNDCYNNSSSVFVSYFDSDYDSIRWHARLGHISQDRMNRLAKESMLDRLAKVKIV